MLCYNKVRLYLQMSHNQHHVFTQLKVDPFYINLKSKVEGSTYNLNQN